jgi:hypothetical protein
MSAAWRGVGDELRAGATRGARGRFVARRAARPDAALARLLALARARAFRSRSRRSAQAEAQAFAGPRGASILQRRRPLNEANEKVRVRHGARASRAIAPRAARAARATTALLPVAPPVEPAAA